MHDWILIDIVVEWENQRVVLKFDTTAGHKELVAKNFSKLMVPRNDEWGPSDCVNETTGPVSLNDVTSRFLIEMQSGDVIELEAQSIILPDGIMVGITANK